MLSFTSLFSRALSCLFTIPLKSNSRYSIRSLLLRAVMHLAARLALLYLFTSEGVQAKPYSNIYFKANLVLPNFPILPLPTLLIYISLHSYSLLYLFGRYNSTLINPISPPKGVPLGSPEGRRRP
jgi:hypothetical protein